jgi:hypothetical protein
MVFLGSLKTKQLAGCRPPTRLMTARVFSLAVNLLCVPFEGLRKIDLGISPGMFPLSPLKAGIEIPWEGGTPGIAVIAVIVIGKAKSAINPGVERCNPGVDLGLTAFNPGVKSGLNRVSPLDLGLTVWERESSLSGFGLPFPRAPGLVGFEMSVDDSQQRACGFVGAPQQIADDVVGFNRPVALDVAQHGRGER